MMVLEIGSELEMLQLGKCLGERLKTGDLLFLSGDLGAGKTTLTKGIAKSLEINEEITSPTFQIQKSYRGRYLLNHLDLYRLKNEAELDIIEPDEITDSGITVVEWGDLLIEKLHLDYLAIKIEYTKKINERIVTINPYGIRYVSLIEGLNEC
jgi:tRNA threonylcarbamoyladenosine biosynthesis protein TsaE